MYVYEMARACANICWSMCALFVVTASIVGTYAGSSVGMCGRVSWGTHEGGQQWNIKLLNIILFLLFSLTPNFF